MALHLTRDDAAILVSLDLKKFQHYCRLGLRVEKVEHYFHLIEKRFDRLVWVIVSMVCWSER